MSKCDTCKKKINTEMMPNFCGHHGKPCNHISASTCANYEMDLKGVFSALVVIGCMVAAATMLVIVPLAQEVLK